MSTAKLRVTEHYNIGPYEWIEIAAEVEGDASSDQALDELECELDNVLQTARLRIQQMTTNDQSMIHEHPAMTGEA